MKEIIDETLYDTDDAKQIYIHKNGYPPNDFKYLRQTLYRTDNGEYFLDLKGGAQTRVAQSVGQHRSGGREIEVLDDDEAYQWLENNADVETVLDEFPERVEKA